MRVVKSGVLRRCSGLCLWDPVGLSLVSQGLSTWLNQWGAESLPSLLLLVTGRCLRDPRRLLLGVFLGS